MTIEKLKNKVLGGGEITPGEAEKLLTDSRKEELYRAAGEITRTCCGTGFDLCSIVNAKSGRCPENCKWCAQSVHYRADIRTYGLIEETDCLAQAHRHATQGIKRFSLVTSGRKPTPKELETIIRILDRLRSETPLALCASMGLLNKNELEQLKNAGVTRYHCNLETAPSFFPRLCSTHTQEEKINTIRTAQEIGMEICSGGIIGMGESARQRLELAFKLRELKVSSIPLNLLQPIAGTPLAGTPPLPDDEILTTIALFRFIHPTVPLRFAGGRGRLRPSLQEKALRTGINAAISGDMLTTTGSKTEEDIHLVTRAGYRVNTLAR